MGRLTARHRLVAAASTVLLLVACSSGGSDRAASTTTAKGAATTTTTAATGAGKVGPVVDRLADYQSKNYDDPAHWLCKPGLADSVCDQDLDTTVIQADGTRTIERFERDDDAPIDCFYVYPTISQDKTPYSDWIPSPNEEGWVTLQQAARLGSVCRVFAPVYRQGTLTSLTTRISGGTIEAKGDPLGDVTDAFRTYLAEDNHGRGFVLIGHSQGAGLLKQLLQNEIDDHEDVRRLLVGAYLAGATVAVPDGKDVGGDLQHVSLCTSDDEAGCITTWSSFAADDPPPADAYFGRAAAGLVAGCENPAAVDGGETALHAYLPATRGGSILTGEPDGGTRTWLADGGEPVTTPFVSLPGIVSGECATTADHHYLKVTMTPSADDQRITDLGGRLTPQWGLHLLDVNLVMGDIVTRVAAQTTSWRP